MFHLTFYTMARQTGPNFFIGKIGNLIYYKRNNVYLVKQAGDSLKKQTKKEKEERNLKEGNIEFGGGAVLSKVFRDTFNSVIEPYNNRALAGRLTGIFRSIIKNGSGKAGKRNAEIRKNKHLLEGFEFHTRNIFEHIFKPALTWEVKKGRKEINLVIPKFLMKGNVSRPTGASHFRITVAVGIISNYTYSKGKKKYTPSEGSLKSKALVASSDCILAKGTVDEIKIPVKLKDVISESCTIVVCTGIQFYKEEGNGMYELETNIALKISRAL